MTAARGMAGAPNRTLHRVPGAFLAMAGCMIALPSILSCSPGPEPPAPAPEAPPAARQGRFSGSRAYSNLEKIMSFGPRAPESEGAEMARRWFMQEFSRMGAAVSIQEFETRDPDEDRTYRMSNLVFSFKPGKGARILLGTHYDTRRRADFDPDPARRGLPVPGANDGGSGAAVLLEIARIVSSDPPGIGIDVVFFDGEDFGMPGNDRYCMGSRHFAGNPPDFVRPGNPAVILDLVGDRNLEIFREENSMRSARETVDGVWRAAARVGAGAFRDEVKHRINDDHVPLQGLGMKAILVIDFDYREFFHTVSDTIDKCSAESLAQVGEAVAEFIYSYGGGS